jgi:transcriptional regulator with XRE-family HTH domain
LIMTVLGDFVRIVRNSQNLTLEQLAARSGLTYRAVQAIETGESERPRRDTLHALAGGLGVPLSALAVMVYEAPPNAMPVRTVRPVGPARRQRENSQPLAGGMDMRLSALAAMVYGPLLEKKTA